MFPTHRKRVVCSPLLFVGLSIMAFFVFFLIYFLFSFSHFLYWFWLYHWPFDILYLSSSLLFSFPSPFSLPPFLSITFPTSFPSFLLLSIYLSIYTDLSIRPSGASLPFSFCLPLRLSLLYTQIVGHLASKWILRAPFCILMRGSWVATRNVSFTRWQPLQNKACVSYRCIRNLPSPRLPPSLPPPYSSSCHSLSSYFSFSVTLFARCTYFSIFFSLIVFRNSCWIYCSRSPLLDLFDGWTEPSAYFHIYPRDLNVPKHPFISVSIYPYPSVYLG